MILLNYSKLKGEKKYIESISVFFWFIVIDIFFLPYFSFMSVTISAPLVMIWVVLHFRDFFRGKEAYASFVLVMSMIASTLIGMIWSSKYLRFETSLRTTVLRFGQYFICFGYYFFFKHFFIQKHVNISKIIFSFSLYVTIFALLFMFFPRLYAEFKILINPADNHTRRYLAGSVSYRFNFLWTDPNNVAYLMDGLVFYYLLDKNNSLRNKLVMALLTFSVVLATASNGGLIILVCVYVYLFFKWFSEGFRINVRNVLTVVVTIIIGYMILKLTNVLTYINDNLITAIVNRYRIYKTTANYSGGRITDIKKSLNLLNPIFLLVGSGKEGFTTENGHLYWICMYGFPSYLAFMYIVFGKFKSVMMSRYVWILPFLVAFTVNIAIGEFKWMGILFLLLACSRYDFSLEECREER